MTSKNQETERSVFITADDRTGAFEIGGLLATENMSIPVGREAFDPPCSVVDIDTRHRYEEDAMERMTSAHSAPALHRCHKMDAGLRGNWPFEVKALVELDYKIAIVPSFPDAGRICKDGVVYINGQTVLDSPFGADPFSAPVSSKPIEVLEATECMSPEIEIWDASDNNELDLAVKRCLEEDRVLVGPAGAVSTYAKQFLPSGAAKKIRFRKPLLIVCGSLNATSREQLYRCDVPRITTDEDMPKRLPKHLRVFAVETPYLSGQLDPWNKDRMDESVAELVRNAHFEFSTLMIIGGDTVAAFLGDETINAIGTVEAGIPVSWFNHKPLITKGGGIGTEDSIRSIIDLLN